MTAKHTRRKLERRAVYENDTGAVFIHFHGQKIKTSLYDISSLGAGLFIPQSSVELPAIGSTIDLAFETNHSHHKKRVSALVCHISTVEKQSKKGVKIGVHFLSADQLNQKRESLQDLPDLFRPLAYAEDHTFYGEYLHFQITAYSTREIVLRTSKANVSLFPGQRLLLRVVLPNLPNGHCYIRITEVEPTDPEKKCYTVRAKWVKPEKIFLESLAEFILLACPELSVKGLIDKGWPAMGLRRVLYFRYSQDEAAFDQILRLRLKAAHSDKRWLDTRDQTKMIDSYDTHSRHIMCMAGKTLVASARLVFNDGIKEKSEHTGYGVNLPSWIWKGGFIEVSRLCTHPDYRGSDVLVFVLQHLGRIVLTSGNAYMLINCADSLVQIYERFGAHNLGVRFDSPFMQGRKLNLMVLDCKKVAVGIGVNPIYYNLGFKRMMQHLEKQGLLKASLFENTFRGLIGLAEPLALKIEKRSRRAKISKKTGNQGLKNSKKIKNTAA